MVNIDLYSPMSQEKQYHRLAKTTSKPRATKKRSGELEPPGPPVPPVLLADGAVVPKLAVAVAVEAEVDIVKRERIPASWRRSDTVKWIS